MSAELPATEPAAAERPVVERDGPDRTDADGQEYWLFEPTHDRCTGWRSAGW